MLKNISIKRTQENKESLCSFALRRSDNKNCTPKELGLPKLDTEEEVSLDCKSENVCLQRVKRRPFATLAKLKIQSLECRSPSEMLSEMKNRSKLKLSKASTEQSSDVDYLFVSEIRSYSKKEKDHGLPQR